MVAAVPVLIASCTREVRREPSPRDVLGEGLASWYGPGFDGKRTASGERFDEDALTAAHRTLPFGTCVVVHNLDTGAKVAVRINDRGPYAKGRVLDVSKAAAKHLGMLDAGVAHVRLHPCTP
ncbi:MAG: septal ring lytic transglycosylase RlpA family protein [Myxococcaceae bacterium]|nr:septal ring lytic transglycosylase RlpA family protein [Myxococcaceae bacterium]